MKFFLNLLAGALMLLPAALAAQQPQTEAPPPPPPIREPLPPKVTDPSASLEPEVRIRREDDRTVEEYRVQGKVYMVRIKPTIGPAYYLVDTTGDGLLDLRHDRFEPVKPTYWKLFEW